MCNQLHPLFSMDPLLYLGESFSVSKLGRLTKRNSNFQHNILYQSKSPTFPPSCPFNFAYTHALEGSAVTRQLIKMASEVSGFRTICVKFNEKCSSYHFLFCKRHSTRDEDAKKPPDKTLFVVNIPPYCTKVSAFGTRSYTPIVSNLTTCYNFIVILSCGTLTMILPSINFLREP